MGIHTHTTSDPKWATADTHAHTHTERIHFWLASVLDLVDGDFEIAFYDFWHGLVRQKVAWKALEEVLAFTWMVIGGHQVASRIIGEVVVGMEVVDYRPHSRSLPDISLRIFGSTSF